MNENIKNSVRTDEKRNIDQYKKVKTIPTPEERAYLLKYYTEHIETLVECLHFAKQDLAQFYAKLDITHSDKRHEAQRVVDDLSAEIETFRTNLSKLRAGEGL